MIATHRAVSPVSVVAVCICSVAGYIPVFSLAEDVSSVPHTVPVCPQIRSPQVWEEGCSLLSHYGRHHLAVGQKLGGINCEETIWQCKQSQQHHYNQQQLCNTNDTDCNFMHKSNKFTAENSTFYQTGNKVIIH